MMRDYPPRIRRLIRQFAARAYEAELAQALTELEQQFALWHAGQISADQLNDQIYTFTRGPSRDLALRYAGDVDDMQVGYAITNGLLPRHEMPAELLQQLQPIIAFYERDA